MFLLFRHKPNHIISSLKEKHLSYVLKTFVIWFPINYYPEAIQAHLN